MVLYSGWYLWSQHFNQGRTSIANVGHVASFFSDAMATVSGGLTGVSIPFSRFGELADIANSPPGPVGWIPAVLIVILVATRIWRGGYSRTIWASMGVVFTYWLAAALSDPLIFGTQAISVRYVLPGTVGVLLVVIDACKGIRLGRTAMAGLIALFAFSVAMNLVFLRDGASYIRTQSVSVRTNLAMLELGNDWLPGGGPIGGDGAPRAQLSPLIGYLGYGPDRNEYLAAVARYGSPAFDLDEVRALPQTGLRNADRARARLTRCPWTPRTHRGIADSAEP